MAKKNGFNCRKTGPIPAKADPVAQQHFLETALTPVLDEAQAGQRHVFFVDAAHFVLGAWLGYLWCLPRIFLPTPSGRQRFNGLGALHAITHEIITVTNDSSMNSESVVALLEKLAKKFTDLPITLVLDNARYQRNAFVMAEAERLHITLLRVANLFAPPQFTRTLMEICQSRVFARTVLPDIRSIQKGEKRLLGTCHRPTQSETG